MLRIRTNKERSRLLSLPFPVRAISADVQFPTLLVVDDDAQVLRVARRLLGGIWNIQTANDALEAAHILKRRRFDAILTDFEMPGEDGLWLLEIARRYHPFIRRVLFSGSGPSDLSEHIRSGLVHSFVAKPADRAELVASLLWQPKKPSN